MQVAFTQFRQPLSWGDDCIAPTWSYAYIDGKGVMCATWLIQGKFATVYFAAKKTDIGVCGAYGITEMDELNSSVSLQLQYSQGNIEFDKIVYSTNMKAIFIPYGIGSDFMGSYYSCLYVSLYEAITGSAVSVQNAGTKGGETYYNLGGQKIDPETSGDKIVIKSDGVSAEKILNKR